MWIQSDGSEAFVLGKIVLGCYLLHLVSLHASSLVSFPPRPHCLGALSNACRIFLFRFTLWALPKLLSSPILTNAIFSCVHPHSNSQHLASPRLALHLTFPPGREKDKTQQIWFN